MKERGIIFSAPMVLAILGGVKTQTRRLMLERHATPEFHARALDVGVPAALEKYSDLVRCPYGAPGDRLWVREVWAATAATAAGAVHGVLFKSGVDFVPIANTKEAADAWGKLRRNGDDGWRSPIYMPRWASRILLEVVHVGAERLRSISEADAIAEGMRVHQGRWGHGGTHPVTGFPKCFASARSAYADLWDTMHAEGNPWAVNPWVWKVTFRKVQA